jgi:hypothetical protein
MLHMCVTNDTVLEREQLHVSCAMYLLRNLSNFCEPSCLFMQNDAAEQIQERTERVVADLKDKWEKTEEKPAFIGLTAASIVGIYVLNGVVDALEGVPLFSGLFKLIGIFVSSWFVYRYLVFAPDREELQTNIKTFFKKVQGKA